ncbi:MAG: GTPase ObgE [Candidatus Neomarinimicrobiota bacterium]|nr:MAG: GTPase ObgE [Candidatus Neomarinimicrobiota bacterium]
MKFVDIAQIEITAGNGGGGCVSFHREKFMPKGGPDGGDGGDGGSVIVIATSQLHTLQDMRYNRKYKADNGRPGEGNNRSGKKGKDITIKVPVGTLIKNLDKDNEVIADMVEDKQIFVAAKGGNGGWGNQHFANSVNKAPRFAKPGLPGDYLNVELELKILADVGLVGFPNAGKSTLLSTISAAKPKIADYPFTTLIPNLGIIRYGDYKSFVMADIPGLIEGAHLGKGLGDQFLRHIERTQVLLFMVDVNELDIKKAYETLLKELTSFNAELAHKPRLLCITKMDSVDIESYEDEFEIDIPVMHISSVTRYKTDELIYTLAKYVE